MEVIADPEGAELSHLVTACPLSGRRVLEVGCGRGTLTRQDVRRPQGMVALDKDSIALRQARIDHPVPSSEISFFQAGGEALPIQSRSFEIVLFSSSF